MPKHIETWFYSYEHNRRFTFESCWAPLILEMTFAVPATYEVSWSEQSNKSPEREGFLEFITKHRSLNFKDYLHSFNLYYKHFEKIISSDRAFCKTAGYYFSSCQYCHSFENFQIINAVMSRPPSEGPGMSHQFHFKEWGEGGGPYTNCIRRSLHLIAFIHRLVVLRAYAFNLILINENCIQLRNVRIDVVDQFHDPGNLLHLSVCFFD